MNHNSHLMGWGGKGKHGDAGYNWKWSSKGYGKSRGKGYTYPVAERQSNSLLPAIKEARQIAEDLSQIACAATSAFGFFSNSQQGPPKVEPCTEVQTQPSMASHLLGLITGRASLGGTAAKQELSEVASVQRWARLATSCQTGL